MIKIDKYDRYALQELEQWKRKMRKKPSLVDRASKGMQNKFNNILPEKYHQILTAAIKNMLKAVLLGSEFIAKSPYYTLALWEREELVADKIRVYKRTARLEGAYTGAGGFLMSLADFPLLIGIKIKFLYDVAAIYGFDVRDYRERIYILNIFQLAFSSQENVNKVFLKLENWDDYKSKLPRDLEDFEWRKFQQEYRDYIDLQKLMQMLPFIGAIVGFHVNGKLMDKLALTAMNAYRMRLFKQC